MQICRLITLRHFLFLLLIAACAVLAPYFFQYHSLGSAPVIPTGGYNVADYYYERMQEIVDGHPFLGNPYFIEHRDDMPPAFFLADWFAVVPLLFGVSLMHTALIDFFVWSLIFLVLAYVLLRKINVSTNFALVGAILTFLSVYMHMIRPVSMQVIYPFFLIFLIALVCWLKDPTNKRIIYLTGLSAALTAYIYTYAWQIVIVTLFLIPCAFWLTKRAGYLRAYSLMISVFGLASLPLVLFTWKQVHTPFYWETIQRIGLVNTHLPASAVVSSCIWVPVMFLLWILLSRTNDHVTIKGKEGSVFLFFVLTGVAMVGVTISNIITGKDLELPQHIERFTILWLSFASVYSIYFFAQWGTQKKLSSTHFLLGSMLIAVLFYGNMRYLITYGPIDAFAPLEKNREMQIQGFSKPLSWLNENIKDQSVIWADPSGELNRYITMMTKHYVLFYAGGPLHIISNNESDERYLVSHYFALTEPDLENDYWAYGGVGNAVHQWKTHNREVMVCQMLHLDKVGFICGALTDRVGWKGKSYFVGLFAEYQNNVRPNITKELQKYHVTYIIKDAVLDTSTFRPEMIPSTKVVYADGRFTIYKIDLP